MILAIRLLLKFSQQKAEVFDGSQIQDADLDKAVNLSRSGMIANQKKALQYMLKVSVDG